MKRPRKVKRSDTGEETWEKEGNCTARAPWAVFITVVRSMEDDEMIRPYCGSKGTHVIG